jgi:hypothetical protein
VGSCAKRSHRNYDAKFSIHRHKLRRIWCDDLGSLLLTVDVWLEIRARENTSSQRADRAAYPESCEAVGQTPDTRFLVTSAYSRLKKVNVEFHEEATCAVKLVNGIVVLIQSAVVK